MNLYCIIFVRYAKLLRTMLAFENVGYFSCSSVSPRSQGARKIIRWLDVKPALALRALQERFLRLGRGDWNPEQSEIFRGKDLNEFTILVTLRT
jgi:hypothetical protein